MSLPGFNAQFSAYRSIASYGVVGATSPVAAVSPQASACTPCVQLGGGRHCFNILGRNVCVNIPSFGRWRVCCRLRLGWPPITCSINAC